MANNNNNGKNGSHKMAANDGTVEVLYQKMGNRWFAFSLVDDEVFVGSISQEEVNASLAPAAGDVDNQVIQNHLAGNS